MMPPILTTLFTSITPIERIGPKRAAFVMRMRAMRSPRWNITGNPPLERLRTLVHAFIRSECKEARMRVALNDAAPLYRDAPEAQEVRTSGDRIVQVFMQEALPNASHETRALVGDLIITTLSTVGKQLSETPRTTRAIKSYADAMADMFCAYLGDIEGRELLKPRASG